MIKRVSVIGLLVALIIGGATCISFAAVSLKLHGGYSMLSPSDYNDYMQGRANTLITWGLGSASVDGLDSAISYGVDVRYGKNHGLLYSLGFTRFSGKAGYDWTSLLGLFSVTREDTISATGVLGSVVYVLENGIYFGGGAGYYKVTLQKTLPTESVPFDIFEYTAEKRQFGFHALGGFQYRLRENIALAGEILYRGLTISDMEFTEHDNPVFVGQTWGDINLSGPNIRVGIIIYT